MHCRPSAARRRSLLTNEPTPNGGATDPDPMHHRRLAVVRELVWPEGGKAIGNQFSCSQRRCDTQRFVQAKANSRGSWDT